MRTRPEVIIISSKNNLIFAEIFKKVKTNPDLKELSENMKYQQNPKNAERGTHVPT